MILRPLIIIAATAVLNHEYAVESCEDILEALAPGLASAIKSGNPKGLSILCDLVEAEEADCKKVDELRACEEGGV